jgi:putative toxin-antitoxin system antitoxin component (TIGR02293 family)
MSASQHKLLSELGISPDSLNDKIEYIRSVREGLSGLVVKNTVKLLENRELVVRILGTTSSNLNRYYRVKNMSRTDSEEMLDTIRLYDKAARVFGSMEQAKEWIKSPIPALSGEKPEDLFDTFEGRKWVAQVLGKIEYGEFV